MQFWLKCSIAISLASLGVGCASPEDRVVNEDHQYVNAQDRAPLAVPQGISSPKGSQEYVLPEVKATGPVGEALDIKSPPQLFTLASGSRLDDKNKVNKIWFDRTNVVLDLERFAFDAMVEFLTFNEVKDSTVDEQNKTVTTGWVHQTKEEGFWLWDDGGKTLSYRFATKQKVVLGGAAASVEVKLIGHKVGSKDVPLSSLSQDFINRAETAFLNDYIFHYQLMQEDLMRKAKVAIDSEFNLALTQNADGNWGFHSAKSADIVWGSLQPLLQEVGFNIDDVNRSTKTLYLTLAEKDSGFWSSLWSDDDAFEVSLTPGQYIVKVHTDEQRQSDIIFYDKDEKPLARNMMRSLEEVIGKAGRKLELQL